MERNTSQGFLKYMSFNGAMLVALSWEWGSVEPGGGLWDCWDTREGSVAGWGELGFCKFSVPSSAFSLKKRIAECQYWPVEVCRMPVTSSSKGKTSKADKVEVGRDTLLWLVEQRCVIGHFFLPRLCYTRTSLEPAKASQRAGGFVKGLISLIELLNKQRRVRFFS